MTLSRFVAMPALLSGLVVLGLVLTPAAGNSGENPDTGVPARPVLYGSVSWGEGLAIASVEGPAGSPVSLRVTIITAGASGASVTQSDLAGVLDANGVYSYTAALGDLASWADFDIVLEAHIPDGNGGTVVSDAWGLRKRTFDPSSPQAPSAPVGGVGAVAAPGTIAPLLPYSWATMQYGQDVVLFQCAPTGIEGVIPVN